MLREEKERRLEVRRAAWRRAEVAAAVAAVVDA
jgi:hypothetical protein